MKTRKITIFIICAFLIFPFKSFSTEPVDKPVKPFQLSIFPVVGTDGSNAINNSYKVSLNLFAGITGGTEGFELGAFANINKGSMNGVQISGFANLVTEQVQGVQLAGFANIAAGNYDGIGISGFANVTAGDAQGIFAAGFANFAGGDLQGIQLSGFMNMAAGLQGLQTAGFMNMGSDIQGFQVAGFMNMARDMQGFQVAGFMNMARDIQGFQVAGFMNMAREVHGFQLGFINIADTITGVPVGFLSIVKRGGYRALEISASDAFFINASFKIGVPQFYNIFSFGTRPFSDAPLSGTGYGIGTEIYLSPASYLNIEAHTSRLFDFAKIREREVNQLSELRAIFSFPVSERLNVFAGPVLYNQVIKEDPVTGIEGLSVSSYDFHTTTFRDYYSQWWVGARAGLSFRVN